MKTTALRIHFIIAALLMLSVNVYGQITTSVTGTNFCQGQGITVFFTSPNANVGNTFTVELSDPSGSFNQSQIIGSLMADTGYSVVPGSIYCTIPNPILSGGGYRIRVNGSSPLSVGADNGSDLIIGGPNLVISSISNVTCFGLTDGSATVTVTNPVQTGGYSYYWSPGNPTGSSTSSITNAAPNNYTVVVMDPYGCSSTATAAITQPSAIQFQAPVTTPPFCNGGADGSIVFAGVTGGTPYVNTNPQLNDTITYQYAISAGASVIATNFTGNFDQLASGSYFITITDSNGCTTSASAVLQDHPLLSLDVVPDSQYICTIAQQGATVSLQVNGGVQPYTFDYSDTLNLFAGTYSYTVVDSVGCAVTQQAVVLDSNCSVGAISTILQTTISGFCAGDIMSGLGGGVAGIPDNASFSVSFTSTPVNTGNTFTVELSDAYGDFNNSTTIGVLATSTLSLGNGDSISCSIPAGTPPGTQYRIRVNSSDPLIIGTDNGADLAVYHPEATISSFTNTTCSNGDTGSVTLTISGANGIFSQLFSIIEIGPVDEGTVNALGSNSYSITNNNLIPGSYNFLITDSSYCPTGGTFLIQSLSPTIYSGEAQVINPACAGQDTGSILIATPFGGTPFTDSNYPTGYNFNLITQNGVISNTTGTFNGLAAGAYSLFTSDSLGCTSDTIVLEITISNPLVLSVTPDSQGVCISSTGTVSLSAEGGFSPYIFSGADTTNLQAGTYSYYVTDANGCSDTAQAILTSYQCIEATITPPDSGKVTSSLGAELFSLLGAVDSTTGNINASSIDSTIYNVIGNTIRIEVISNETTFDTVLSLLQQPYYGMTDLVNNGEGSLVISGTIPIANLSRLEPISGRFNLINFIRPLSPPVSNQGLVNSQGDSAIRAVVARKLFAVDGEGIKIGVISDSYNKAPGNQAAVNIINGDLPGDAANTTNPYPVEVVKDYIYATKTDEGRAMLQIVHDLAPKSELAFRTGFISSGDFAEGIYELAEAGCDVIVDDVTYITEPYFKDGLVSQAVDSVKSAGVSYFTSAGNFGSSSYEGMFNPIAAPTGYTGFAHDFGGGDIQQQVTLNPGAYTIVLQWDDNYYSLAEQPGAQHDFDIYLLDQTGNLLFG
ncbi:MAG: hypothetical protein RIQ47_1334, partial [Bacteroidota bacterium]